MKTMGVEYCIRNHAGTCILDGQWRKEEMIVIAWGEELVGKWNNRNRKRESEVKGDAVKNGDLWRRR